jgi:hypothetical protein
VFYKRPAFSLEEHQAVFDWENAGSTMRATPRRSRDLTLAVGAASNPTTQGLSRAEVVHALREVAGSDGRLLEKVPGVMKSLERYGRLKSPD